MNVEELRTSFNSALVKGDRQGAEKLFDLLLEQNEDLFFLYDDFLKDAMYSIGKLWEKGKISVATEHLASAIVESLMHKVYNRIQRKALLSKSVVVSCVENEYHQIGPKMVADVFESQGWETYFLGANTPLQSTIMFAKEHQVEVIALSMSIYYHLPVLEQSIKAIHKELPHVLVLVGGQGLTHGGSELFEDNPLVIAFQDLKQLDQYLTINH